MHRHLAARHAPSLTHYFLAILFAVLPVGTASLDAQPGPQPARHRHRGVPLRTHAARRHGRDRGARHHHGSVHGGRRHRGAPRSDRAPRRWARHAGPRRDLGRRRCGTRLPSRGRSAHGHPVPASHCGDPCLPHGRLPRHPCVRPPNRAEQIRRAHLLQRQLAPTAHATGCPRSTTSATRRPASSWSRRPRTTRWCRTAG